LIVAICEVFDETAKTFMNISVNSTDVARQMMQNSIEKQTLLAKMDVVRMTIVEINQVNNNQAANEDLIFTIQFLLNVVKSTLLANKSN
jgi:ABC-type phosphate transport system permease subunit